MCGIIKTTWIGRACGIQNHRPGPLYLISILFAVFATPPGSPVYTKRGCHRLRPALPHHSPTNAAALPEQAHTAGTSLQVCEGLWKSTIMICAVVAPGLPQPGQWVAWIARTAGFITSLAACLCAAPFAARNTEWRTYSNVYSVVKEQRGAWQLWHFYIWGGPEFVLCGHTRQACPA